MSLMGILIGPIEAIAQPEKGESIIFRTKETVTSQRFSVDYPDHWSVTQNDNDYVIIYNQRPAGVTTTGATSLYLIKTDVSIQPNSLRDAILGIGDEPEDIQRIELVEINFYSSENQAAEDAIIQMHNTLRVFD
jgi:hypothetical protein